MSRNTWNDPAITSNPRIDKADPVLRRAAEALHANESLHRHYAEGPVCIYCALLDAIEILAGAR